MIWFLDLEATGLHPTAYPIEVAAVADDLSHAYTAPIQPVTKAGWDEYDWGLEAEKIHRLDRPHLVAYGEPAADIARALNTLIADGQPMSDSIADAGWLRRLYEATATEPRFPLSTPAAPTSIGHAAASIWRGDAKWLNSQVATDLALNRAGGGLEFFDRHQGLLDSAIQTLGLVEHRALDDALRMALGFALVDTAVEFSLPEYNAILQRTASCRKQAQTDAKQRFHARFPGHALDFARAPLRRLFALDEDCHTPEEPT